MTQQNKGHGRGKQTKSQRRDDQERKRDGRAIKSAYRKQKKDQSYLADDENFAGFATQLQTIGLQLRDIPGDGNCLFRALGDQLEGHGRNHLRHRDDTVQYIIDHRQLFEPFVEDDVPFDRHVCNLRKSGTYAGNDAIVAFARLKELTVVIHQLNAPVFKVSGNDKPGSRELHIAYHNGDHYSSVRKLCDNTGEATNFKTASAAYSGSAGCQYSKKKSKTKSDASSDGACGGPSDLCNGEVDDVELNIMQIIELTGCQDVNLVRESLQDHFYDVPATVDFIMALLASTDHQQDDASLSKSESGGLWDADGTGSRIFGDASPSDSSKNKQNPNKGKTQGNTGTKGRKNELRLTNAQRKKQNRMEKKERQSERHKQRLRGGASQASQNTDDDDNALVVDGLQSLRI
ncbi:OTU domain-containing protein 3-like [Anneissia japonica]|uniref:OTU domain-containing protein 3-like n=1 Tax=Anneissia japonica TaxID=1529436 RepID=UPI00142576B8|nr:OTU domain-containing protein 3-like [Anneissia japonica]